MPRWNVFPHFIVRTTGFPFELTEQLRCPDTVAALGKVARVEAELDALRRSAPRIHHPPRAVLAALRGNRAVPLHDLADPSLFTDWNALARSLEEAKAVLEEAASRELPQGLARLKAIAEEPRFQEAIASSSPPVYLDLARQRWSTRVERQVASYVQRLSAKNETMSFFGPINYGRFDPSAEDGIQLSWSGPARLKGRRTHAASWMVQGLVSAIAFDPGVAPWLVLRRKGYANAPLPRARKRLGELLVEMRAVTVQQVERMVHLQGTKARPLGELLVEAAHCTPDELAAALRQQASGREPAGGVPDDVQLLGRLVEESDGTRRLEVLAQRLGVTLERLLPVVQRGCDKRLLTHQLEVPSAAYLPIQALIERIAGIPGPAARLHLEGLEQVLERMGRYSPADAGTKVRLLDEVRAFVEERWGVRSPFAPTPGAPPPAAGERRRSDGQFYADRLPMREECGGDLRLRIGGARATEIAERVQAPLDLLASASERTRRAALARVAQLLGHKRAPFWKVVAAFAEQPIPYDTSLTEWIAATPRAPDARALSLDPSTYPPVPPPDGLPLICSVDLLICAGDLNAFARGEYQVVMGDIHDTAQVWGWALQFMDDRRGVETEMVRAIGRAARELPIVTALASRRTGLLPSEFPGPVIELGGVSDRPSAWRMPFDDLWVESDGQSARLWSESLQSEVALYNGELESLVHTAFAIPRIRAPKVDFGAHTPRISVGQVVLQRETWVLPAAAAQELAACKDDRARLAAAARLWASLSLPQVVFAKFPGERKPVLIDPANPFVLRAFSNMLEEKGSATLTEMLPSTEQLWLKSDLGRHTVELRCSFIRGPQ